MSFCDVIHVESCIIYLMKYLLILAALTQICVVLAQTPPILPPQFTLEFTETAKLITTGTTKGTIYYDQTHNREVVAR